MTRISKIVGRGTAVAVAVGIGASTALAGGFAVREQSALGQGASFAGAGASTALSAMFWNSAAVTSLDGLNTDSNITAILPSVDLTALTGSTRATADQTADYGRNGYVPASYVNYQLKGYDPKMYVGLGVNSAFGLGTKPDSRWAGAEVANSTKLFTVNFNPVLGYKFSDALSVAAGPTFEYAKATFKFATGSPTGPNTSFLSQGDMAVGATAGLMYTPTQATRIGLGWRSQITHDLNGTFATGGSLTGNAVLDGRLNAGVAAKTELRLPDIVTLSLQQAFAPNLRLLASVEWTNWSRFDNLTLTSTGSGYTLLTGGPGVLAPAGSKIGVISAKWDDGWFFSGGLEYDVNNKLTVRGGVAYEITPEQKTTEKLLNAPDVNRIWASGGLSYKVSPSMDVDFAYTHIFGLGGQLDRTGLSGVRIIADIDASADIVSLGMRMKLN